MGSDIRIVYSLQDPAALNIAGELEKIGTAGFKMEGFDGSQLEFRGERGKQYIMLSRHKSEKRVRSLTCHHTGNWTGEALYGGKPGDVCISMPSVMCGISREISKRVGALHEYSFSLEVTHHGPTGDFAVLFVEIGSCEEDWGNRKAGQVIAEAIACFEPCKEGEAVMGVGGPHYAPNFTRLSGKYRIGHIIPKYAVDGLEYDAFVRGIEKSAESIGLVVIDWKGLGGKQREKVTGFCNMRGIEWLKYG